MNTNTSARFAAVLFALALGAAACSSGGSTASGGDTTTDSGNGGETTAAADSGDEAPQGAELSGVLRTSENLCVSDLGDKEMEELKVGFSQIDSEGAWRIAETESMEAQLDRVAEVVVTNAQGDLARQNTDIEDLVNQGVDVILLAPLTSDGLDSGLSAAQDAGIPVLFIDRSHEGEACESFESFISSDFVEQGRIAGERLAEATDGKAKIIQLEGTSGSDVAVDRKTGFDEVIEANPDMEVVASQTANFNRAEGQQLTSQLLQSNPDVTAIYAHNDEMAIGAITALEAIGRQPGVDVTVVSIDGTKDAFDAIKEGKMLLTVESNPRFGPMAFDALQELTLDRSLPDRIVIEDRVFDSSNVDEFYDLGY